MHEGYDPWGVFMIPVFPLLAREYARKRGLSGREWMCGQWKDRGMVSFMTYIYPCLYCLVSGRPTSELPHSSQSGALIGVVFLLH